MESMNIIFATRSPTLWTCPSFKPFGITDNYRHKNNIGWWGVFLLMWSIGTLLDRWPGREDPPLGCIVVTKKNNQLVRPSTVLWSIPAFGFQLLLAKTLRIRVWRIENLKKASFLEHVNQGSENFQKPIISQKMKIIVWGCLIAQMKRFDALITTQKNPSSLQGPISLKIKKKCKKNCHFWKMVILGNFSRFFSKMGLCRALGFFCVVISASKRFIWAIKHPHLMIFIFWLKWAFAIFQTPGRGCQKLIFKTFKIIFSFIMAEDI